MDNFLFAALYIGVMVFFANQESATGVKSPVVRPMLYGLAGLLLMVGLNAIFTAMLPPEQLAQIEVEPVGMGQASVAFAVSALASVVCVALVYDPRLRLSLKRVIGPAGTYQPDSILHTCGVVIAVALVAGTISTFVLIGGWEGLALSLQEAPPSLSEQFFSNLIYVVLALLGTGLYIRRTPLQIIERLALRLPLSEDLRSGVLTGAALFIGANILLVIWATFVSPELLEQQTVAAEEVFAAFSSTLLSGFLLSLFSAVSEEILYRGALQPVFGIGISSLLFTVAHLQYLLTPAALIIFAVSLGFSWLRRRYSTSAAIIAHFVYNFIPFVLSALLSSIPGAGL